MWKREQVAVNFNVSTIRKEMMGLKRDGALIISRCDSSRGPTVNSQYQHPQSYKCLQLPIL